MNVVTILTCVIVINILFQVKNNKKEKQMKRKDDTSSSLLLWLMYAYRALV